MKRLLSVLAAGILGLAGCKGLDTPKPDGQASVKGSASGQFQTGNAAGTATGQFQTGNAAGTGTIQTNAYRPGAGATTNVQPAGGVMQPAGGAMQQTATGSVVPAGGPTAAGTCPVGACSTCSCPSGACAAGACPTAASVSGQFQNGSVQVGGAAQLDPLPPVKPH
jgi:hypothetical protein